MPKRMGQSKCSMEIRGRIAALAEADCQLGKLDTVRPGAAYATNADRDNAIVEIADNLRFISTVRIRETLQLTCSLKTIRRRLHENGIHNRQPARKIVLTPDHAAAGLAFYQANINRDWSNVILSDEKAFSSMFYHEEQAGVLMPVFGAGCPKMAQERLLRVTPSRFSSRQYIRVLEDVLLPSVSAVYPEDKMATFIFVQDNSSIRTAQIVQEWFEEHPEIELLRWPAKSADLNPIENL
ncbi:hypothetical protein ILUMI_13866 [Ignelater luminosus]|uniref:Transposase n=1 Tax=Ignelater luminosus TaxID=2038154 RepID=A0A8K0CWZ9_IGNLU|nr:hypothetical protein ILUMI_13866 [Ignelater luminosus]